jgi:hypothetical protein
MEQREAKTMRRIVMICLLLPVWSSCWGQAIGSLQLSDGTRYYISRFGTTEQSRQYHVNAERRFIPFDEIRQVVRVGAGLSHRGYSVILDDGELLNADLGSLFFESVTYRESNTGPVKQGFSAVLKGRASDGLLFIAYNPDTGAKHPVEIYNPNEVIDLVLWDAATARVQQQRLATRLEQKRRQLEMASPEEAADPSGT